jgi:membrane-bound serine protease (ClpP class)
MDLNFLLNPNVAYVVLVAGFLLAILALFTPGTGMFEVGALFCLLIGGWQIANLPVNLWALGLILLGAPPFLLAVRKSGQAAFLVIAIAILEIGSVYLFQSETWWVPAVNPILALITIVSSSSFLWLAIRKSLEALQSRLLHDLRTLVGQNGEAKTDVFTDGTVQVAGELWSAQSRERVPAGAAIKVIGRDGFILLVERM